MAKAMQRETGERHGDIGRVLADLKTLASFGSIGVGVTRPAFSEADLAARRWLADRFAAAGLEASIDGAGNLMGRDPQATITVLTGSHSDTVPRGGWLDGALGVIFGLEAARAWRAARPTARAGVDVISFADEEGTFDACVGSRAFCGFWDGLAPEAATPLATAMRAAGLSGQPTHRLDPLRHKAYLEAHIEQGPRLEAGGIAIGVVEGIVGVRRQRVTFSGRADHAGTTPMNVRQNAGRAMLAFGAALDQEWQRSAGPDAVWNMGVVSMAPNAANVVPARAEVVVEYRHLDLASLERMTAQLQDFAARSDVPVAIEQVGALQPSMMDVGLIDALRAAAMRQDDSTLTLASGAGHDAMILARRMPAAMMFVPSIGGRSHDPAENTSDHDLAIGLRVYVDWVFGVLDRLAEPA